MTTLRRRRNADYREAVIFIDLVGASGVSYRFRVWPGSGQAAIAGNFVVAERTDEGIKVHMVGVTGDLSRASSHARQAGLGDRPLFIRLNVARQIRRQECEDIVARYAPLGLFNDEA